MTGVWDGIAAFAAAILAGLGVGSGGLYLLYLTGVAGVPQRTAQGRNLLFGIAALAASALWNARHRRIAPLPFLLAALPGAAGAAAGAALAFLLPLAFLRRALALSFLAGGGAVLLSVIREKKREKRRGEFALFH